jgi:hypothetical protein
VAALVSIVCAIGGCGSPPRESAPSTQPAATAPSAGLQSFRPARAEDLRMLVATRKPGPDGFPIATIQLWNNSSDEVIVEYQAGSVVLHCGPFEQHGPAFVLGRRREILDPQQELDFTMPTGNWYRSPTTGPKDLMLPSDLEKGKYPMWATFRVPGPNGGIVESDKDAYEVP